VQRPPALTGIDGQLDLPALDEEHGIRTVTLRKIARSFW
jgi:hypothetical protein